LQRRPRARPMRAEKKNNGKDDGQQESGAKDGENVQDESTSQSSTKATSLSDHFRLNRIVFSSCFWAVMPHILILLISAIVYNNFRMHWNLKPERENNPWGFRYGLFTCFKEPLLTLMVVCCAPLRWADNMDKANDKQKFLSYWPAILLWVLTEALAYFLYCASTTSFTADVIQIIMLGVFVLFRQRLREKDDTLHINKNMTFYDCFAWCCCGCCAIIQEARQVEYLRND